VEAAFQTGGIRLAERYPGMDQTLRSQARLAAVDPSILRLSHLARLATAALNPENGNGHERETYRGSIRITDLTPVQNEAALALQGSRDVVMKELLVCFLRDPGQPLSPGVKEKAASGVVFERVPLIVSPLLQTEGPAVADIQVPLDFVDHGVMAGSGLGGRPTPAFELLLRLGPRSHFLGRHEADGHQFLIGTFCAFQGDKFHLALGRAAFGLGGWHLKAKSAFRTGVVANPDFRLEKVKWPAGAALRMSLTP